MSETFGKLAGLEVEALGFGLWALGFGLWAVNWLVGQSVRQPTIQSVSRSVLEPVCPCLNCIVDVVAVAKSCCSLFEIESVLLSLAC